MPPSERRPLPPPPVTALCRAVYVWCICSEFQSHTAQQDLPSSQWALKIQPCSFTQPQYINSELFLLTDTKHMANAAWEGKPVPIPEHQISLLRLNPSKQISICTNCTKYIHAFHNTGITIHRGGGGGISCERPSCSSVAPICFSGIYFRFTNAFQTFWWIMPKPHRVTLGTLAWEQQRRTEPSTACRFGSTYR